jgi:hypothetical protein
MKQFLVMFMMSAAAMQDMMKNSSPEDRQKGMEDWGAWMKKHAADFTDPGAPAGKNTRVTKDGATEVSNDIAGYSIMHGESKEAIIALLQDNPHLAMPGAYIEVMERIEMPM